MTRAAFHWPRWMHGPAGHHFHPHPILSVLLAIAGPLVFLYAVWVLLQFFTNWLWTVLPAPLAWGG